MSSAGTAKANGSARVVRVRPGTGSGSEAPLRECVREAVDAYFADLDGHPCRGLYRMVMSEVEVPLLEAVMRHSQGNQSIAAGLLGMNRGTLRKKLKEYDLL